MGASSGTNSPAVFVWSDPLCRSGAVRDVRGRRGARTPERGSGGGRRGGRGIPSAPPPPRVTHELRRRTVRGIWEDCRPHDISVLHSALVPPPPPTRPSKLQHVISYRRNRGGKTHWRCRCLRSHSLSLPQGVGNAIACLTDASRLKCPGASNSTRPLAKQPSSHLALACRARTPVQLRSG
ncbi:hypothetical protein AAFF_G00341920 [Aldrovandia affinis]|uniref:Uncharacterized protein n=1 Tax=Aldrovandia affinis TaxID=143900 RepID=A0AAD7SKS3_9TELE|nr:hypothetical protein AAFF_G00341920 [Aldrovandia affinis]